jgi:hypothetical protein
MNLIDRREALQRVAMLMGGAISAPTLFTLLEGCQPKAKKEGDATSTTRSISEHQQKMISEIAEIIIPTTNTPGAKAAGVPEFIAVVMTDCYSDEDRENFLKGLDQLDEKARKNHQKSFLECQASERIALLKQAESDAIAQKEKDKQANDKNTDAAKEQPALLFFPTMKELTVVGYFTSEIGATQVLEYVPVPGRYEGCTPMKEGQKSWATS